MPRPRLDLPIPPRNRPQQNRKRLRPSLFLPPRKMSRLFCSRSRKTSADQRFETTSLFSFEFLLTGLAKSRPIALIVVCLTGGTLTSSATVSFGSPTYRRRIVYEEVSRASVGVVRVSGLSRCNSRATTLRIAIRVMVDRFLVVSPAALPTNFARSASGWPAAVLTIAALTL